MKHTSKKRRNKKIQIGLLVFIGILLLGSFIFSRARERRYETNINIENKKHIKGSENAKYTLVEYSDFQCPACRSASIGLMELLKKNPDTFNIEFKHFPLRIIHGNAQLAAQAAEAAGLQGKFWEMHDLLFEKQSDWNQSFNPKRFFKMYAKEIGLDVDRFAHDLKLDTIKNIVNSEYNEAQKLKLTGTPSFLLDGKKIDINDFIQKNLSDKKPETQKKK